ncbi:hypothetical protein AKJ45_01755 [candidate division MSBL1 archaeon SCGC-AAA261F19]|uniref:Uncharacterized protein n=2 Tax=candidate division MSBL1 TaxID=215777 RepID=A0A133VA98_9EURY|nr:hypothetical protein AKJ43_03505 [candidate division MSBL1 archaeon SCGC-AAA261D19]KXB03363.1 hypothetical protein AKJ45_01755 [candidate division MSBL1 archaeon SCGC-AAA261F19]
MLDAKVRNWIYTTGRKYRYGDSIHLFSTKRGKIGLGALGMVLFLILSLIFSCPSAYAQDPNGAPTLTENQLTPESGAWGDNFTFKITYIDNENNLPALGYPKVYIDDHPENMGEDNRLDNDVTDGKVYKYVWASTKENIGDHNFYFYVEDYLGRNARVPENGEFEGPNIGKQAVRISCELDNPDPAPGEEILFIGHLETNKYDLDISGENVILYEILSDGTSEAGSDITNENGLFAIELKIPREKLGVYKITFHGSDYFEAVETGRLYTDSLNNNLFLGVDVILLALVSIASFFLSRNIANKDLLKPLLAGSIIGITFQFIVSAFIALFAAGGLAGYMLARETDKWKDHLSIGVMTGLLLLLVFGVLFIYTLLSSPEMIIQYSITQGGVFRIVTTQILLLSVLYSLLTGIGSIIGGKIRESGFFH